MVFLFESTVLELTLCILCLGWMTYLMLTSRHTYWRDKHIAYVKPYFPFGTEKELVFSEVPVCQYYHNIYTLFKNEKLVGLYDVNNPYLLVRDIEIAKLILTKDFQCFMNRGFLDSDLLTSLEMNLFMMEGKRWKNLRSKLTPAFTSGKMKPMLHLMEACSKELIKSLTSSAENGGNVDVKEIIERFTTDVLASCGLGINSNSIRDPDSEFRKNVILLCEAPRSLEIFKLKFSVAFPWLSKAIGLKLFQSVCSNFFINIVKQTMKYREEKGITRNDFVDHLIRLRSDTNFGKRDSEVVPLGGNKDEAGVNIDEIVAQVTVFFFAGLTNTVLTIVFSLYEIASDPDIQSEVLKEVNEVLRKHSGVMSYEAIQSMTYIEAVINETLRRYPTVSFLHRICNEDYKVPGMDLIIEKGTKIVIPVYALHHDPDYFPDPNKFCPERFLDDSRKPAAYFPFGEGPRYCIGVMLSMLIMKLCIAEIIRNFQLSMIEHSPKELVMSAKYFNMTPETPIVLNFSKRVDK